LRINFKLSLSDLNFFKSPYQIYKGGVIKTHLFNTAETSTFIKHIAPKTPLESNPVPTKRLSTPSPSTLANTATNEIQKWNRRMATRASSTALYHAKLLSIPRIKHEQRSGNRVSEKSVVVVLLGLGE